MPDPKLLLSRPGFSVISRRRRLISGRVAWYTLERRGYFLSLVFTPFRGYAVRSIRSDRGYTSEPLSILPPPEFSVKRVQLNSGAAGGQVEHLAAVESKVFHNLHSLVKHCTIVKYEDGTARVVGWFTIQTRGAAWQVVLKDPDSGCKLVATGNTLDDALALAEMLLDSEEAPWEPDPYLKSAQRRNGKKS